MTKKVNFVAIAAAALLIGVPFLLSTEAQEGKVAPTAAAAVEAPAPLDFDLVDPAFDRYVDILLIGQAWDTLDPVLLTDCAMQLAEGERILMRSHKAVSSKQLLELAAKVAADKRDTATLDRLANVCGATKNTATLEQVAAARKLAGSSRKVDPAMSVSATETTPDQLALYQEAINGAKAAGILGDATYFDNLEEGLADKESVLVTLSETQRSHLKKIMGDARGSMPKESNAQLTDTLAKLKDASRQNIGHGIGSIIHGIRDLQNGHHTGHGIGSIIHGISDLAGHGGHGRGGHGHGYRPYNPYNPYNPYRPYNPYNPYNPYRPYNPYNPYRPHYPGHNHGWRP